MKKISALLPIIALIAASSTLAQAEVSSTVTLTSDYDFRGLTQTAGDPALQVSVDWAGESGFYVSAWASNVEFGEDAKANVELDIIGGFKGSFNEDVGFDLGVLQYTYMPDKDKIQFGEAYAGISYKAITAKIWYAWDYGNTGESATYIESNGTIPLPNDFDLALHLGYSNGDYWETTEGSYADYSVGITKDLGNFALALKWVDGSDLKSLIRTTDDVFTSKSKVVFSVSTTLPW